MATFKQLKEYYDPVLSIVSDSFMDNEYLDFSLGGLLNDPSQKQRVRHWQGLEDSDDLSLKLVGGRIQGRTRGFGIKPRKLKSVEQGLYGVESKKTPRMIKAGAFFVDHNGAAILYPL